MLSIRPRRPGPFRCGLVNWLRLRAGPSGVLGHYAAIRAVWVLLALRVSCQSAAAVGWEVLSRVSGSWENESSGPYYGPGAVRAPGRAPRSPAPWSGSPWGFPRTPGPPGEGPWASTARPGLSAAQERLDCAATAPGMPLAYWLARASVHARPLPLSACAGA